MLFALAPPAAAAHRARLSADLADHLSAGSQVIDVIVHGTRADVDALALRYNLRVKRYLKSGGVLRVNAGQLAALQEDEGVDHLSSDIPIRSSANITAEAIGADQVWAGADGLAPLSGAGVGVAVIDSGVDPRHASLRGRLSVSRDFTGGDGVDRFGHGTHVAALIAGAGGRMVETQAYRGIAAGAHIISLRVLGADGSGYASDVIEAIDWAIDNRRRYNIRVINLSLGAPVLQPYRDDPLCEAVERAVAAGMVVVAAAGNYGQTADGRRVFGGITSPGNDPSVITVGALDTHGTARRSDDTVAGYSSRGPTRFDLVLKPDLVAPGSRVVSAEAAGSHLATTYAQRHVAGGGDDGYIQLSGTSMAAAVVSGTVALLAEARPGLSAAGAKRVLQVTSSTMETEGIVSSGTGSLNALASARLIGTGSAIFTDIAFERILPRGLQLLSIQREPRRAIPSNASKPLPDLQLVLRYSYTKLQRRVRVFPRPSGSSLVWGTLLETSGDSLVWGTSDSDSLVWGTSNIILAQSDDSLAWGTSDVTALVWGTETTAAPVWGASADDALVWGTGDVDAEDDSLVWGTAARIMTN
jgi:serine protease AprX